MKITKGGRGGAGRRAGVVENSVFDLWCVQVHIRREVGTKTGPDNMCSSQVRCTHDTLSLFSSTPMMP